MPPVQFSLLKPPPDPRFPCSLRAAVALTLASPVLFIAPIVIAAVTYQSAGVAIAFSILLPLCGLPGLSRRSPSLLSCFITGSALVGFFFVVGAASVVGAVPRLECVCDAACVALPRGGGGGVGRAPSMLTPEQQMSEVWALRNSTVFIRLCERGPSAVKASWVAYAAVGAIAIALQCAACCAVCRMRSTWLTDAQTTPFSPAAFSIAYAQPIYIHGLPPHMPPQAGRSQLDFGHPDALNGAMPVRPLDFGNPGALNFAPPHAPAQPAYAAAQPTFAILPQAKGTA